MKKNEKGFTLVELVVVIAIVGVLAAILVPSLMNYIRKAKLKTANTNAKLAYNAVAAYIVDVQAKDGLSLDDILDSFSNGTDDSGLDCTEEPASNADKEIYTVLHNNGVESGYVWVMGSSADGEVIINGSRTFAVQWSDNPKDTAKVWGQYPDPISWEDFTENIVGSAHRPGTYNSSWS